jgi:hypothetical protein
MNSKIITTFKDYKLTYSNRLINHLEQYEDFDEKHFIDNELDIYKSCYITSDFKLEKSEIFRGNKKQKVDYYHLGNYEGKLNEDVLKLLEDKKAKNEMNNDRHVHYQYEVDIELASKFKQSFIKIIAFLNELKNVMEKNETKETLKPQKETNQNENLKLSWGGSKLELSELIKSLIEAKIISPELSQTEIFKRFNNFFNMEDFDHSDKLKEIRKRTKTTTPLINILEISLNNWIKAKD